jgi:8-oxo-dGTP diphosphatase
MTQTVEPRIRKITSRIVTVKVVAGVIRHSGRILIAQRSPVDRHPLKWEFPGGKIEAGETPQACLKRELFEELGIQVKVGALLAQHLHHNGHCQIDLTACYARWIAGDLCLKVHAQYRWVTVAAMQKFDFLPADLPIIAHLMGLDHR